MKRFAFYGRVSTEDQQDPTSSRNWQLARSRQVIEQAGGEIVAEFFDIGQSRSLPWKRRPEAARLLDSVPRPGPRLRRGRDRRAAAGVLRQPVRAHLPRLHPLRRRAVGARGRRRDRPRIRGPRPGHVAVRRHEQGRAQPDQDPRPDGDGGPGRIEGRFLGGRPPYGYRLADAGPHPNPGKAADGQRLHRLEPDPATAPVVAADLRRVPRRQRHLRDRRGPHAETASRRPRRRPAPQPASLRASPGPRAPCGRSCATPATPAGRSGTGNAATRSLIDVDDVALGHETKLRWNDAGDWVWSSEPSHEPLVDPDTSPALRTSREQARNAPSPDGQPAHDTYLLRGLVRCGACGRRMQGSWNHDRAHYRCKLPYEYALANKVDHPPTIYVREDHVVPGSTSGSLSYSTRATSTTQSRRSLPPKAPTTKNRREPKRPGGN